MTMPAGVRAWMGPRPNRRLVGASSSGLLVAAIDAGAAGADLAYSIVHMIGPKRQILPPAVEMPRYRPSQWMPPTGVLHRRIAVEKNRSVELS